MKRIAYKEKERIVLEFDYDRRVIALVKTLDGRQYIPGRKVWSLPLAGSTESVKKLLQADFRIEHSLWTALEKEREEARQLAAMAQAKDAKIKTQLPLYPFQRAAVAFMLKAKSCLNAYDVGTGKTLMSLEFVVQNKTRKNLVVAPKSLLFQWDHEIATWLPEYKRFVVTGDKEQREEIYRQALKYEGYYFLIVNYECARIDNSIIMEI